MAQMPLRESNWTHRPNGTEGHRRLRLGPASHSGGLSNPRRSARRIVGVLTLIRALRTVPWIMKISALVAEGIMEASVGQQTAGLLLVYSGDRLLSISP